MSDLTVVYVVMDYDFVAYAGCSLITAKTKVKGGGIIDIWKGGKCIGSYTHRSGKWTSHISP